MEVYRLVREKFSDTLSGKGAALKGARWNSMGIELIYTAQNRSLAMAEIAVYLTLATLPGDYVMLTIFIPDNISLQKFDIDHLPENWDIFPHTPLTQAIGDSFVAENKYCLLQVPSAIIHGDHNILINPNHPEFKKIKVIATDKFPFDKRIFK